MPSAQITPSPVHVTIDLGERSYPISIGSQLLSKADTFAGLPRASTAMIVTNEVVGPLYAEAVAQALKHHFQRVLTVTLPDGEAHKNWTTLNLVFDALLENACDRKTMLVALGGGVVVTLGGVVTLGVVMVWLRWREVVWLRCGVVFVLLFVPLFVLALCISHPK